MMELALILVLKSLRFAVIILFLKTSIRHKRVIKLEKRLKRQQRKLSRSYEQNKNRKRGEFCAKNRQKQLVVVQKLHARLANIRKEYIRFVVSAVGENQTSIYHDRRFKRQRHDEKSTFIQSSCTAKLSCSLENGSSLNV